MGEMEIDIYVKMTYFARCSYFIYDALHASLINTCRFHAAMLLMRIS